MNARNPITPPTIERLRAIAEEIGREWDLPHEETTMKWRICTTGQTHPARVSVTLERQALTLVIKGVPAEVCDVCGEQYLDEDTTAVLLAQAEAAVEAGVQVEIRSYRAA